MGRDRKGPGPGKNQKNRGDRKRALRDNERATGDEASPLAAARRAIRAKLPTREIQQVFDELAATRPGPESLALASAVMTAHLLEEARLLKQLRAGKGDLVKLRETLKDHRESTRSLKAVSDALVRAVKVSSDLAVDNLPHTLTIEAADNIWADIMGDETTTTTLPEDFDPSDVH